MTRHPAARGPVTLALPAAVGVGLLTLPLLALVLRAPWTSLPRLLGDAGTRSALTLSLQTAALATAAAAITGVPLAWWMSRLGPGAARLARAVVTLPLVLPPVVGGVALLLAFGRAGVLGGPLFRATGIHLPFTRAAVVLAETFVAMPFLVLSVEAALRALDPELAEAAATLGAGTLAVFRRVTLPLAGPAVAAGGVLCFARALGEFGATITFAGDFPGTTRTAPLAVYLALQDDPGAAEALSLLLLGVSLAVLIGLRGRWRPS